jgi:hypothetical protein
MRPPVVRGSSTCGRVVSHNSAYRFVVLIGWITGSRKRWPVCSKKTEPFGVSYARCLKESPDERRHLAVGRAPLVAPAPAGFRGLPGDRRPLVSGEFLGPCRSTFPPQFNGRLALAVLGVIGMALQTQVVPDVSGCLTRVLDFFRRGFRRDLRRVKLVGELVGEFLQPLAGGGSHRRASRHCHRS